MNLEGEGFLIDAFANSSDITNTANYRIILDADMDSDVDDTEALAMLHTYTDKKIINFLGVIVTSDDPSAPLCVSAINRYYGRAFLPVGFLKNQAELEGSSKYTEQIGNEFPHQLKSHENAPDAVALYRKLLSDSPDQSVIIITTGHLTSLQNLLKSVGDRYSHLSGKELTEKKVVKWICMGGMFPAGKEANFSRPDPGATKYCLQEWQKPITFVGWEAGNQVITGDTYLKNKLTPENPVYRAYELYNSFGGRPSWDQLAVFLLDKKSAEFITTVKGGYCQVYDDGSNKWLQDKDSKHEYISFKPGINTEDIARYLDDLIDR